jgi:hypothetical protein
MVGIRNNLDLVLTNGDSIYLYPIKIGERLKDFIQKDITEKIKYKNNLSFLQRVFKKIGICK